jgi:hypothetical protein
MNETLKTSIANNFKNTALGFLRIRKNLRNTHLTDLETEIYLKNIILETRLENIKSIGKNHYFMCFKENALLTINSHSFTVITAKVIDKNLLEQ